MLLHVERYRAVQARRCCESTCTVLKRMDIYYSSKLRQVQIGKVGTLEEVEEYRVEAICLGRDTAVEAVKALRE